MRRSKEGWGWHVEGLGRREGDGSVGMERVTAVKGTGLVINE